QPHCVPLKNNCTEPSKKRHSAATDQPLQFPTSILASSIGSGYHLGRGGSPEQAASSVRLHGLAATTIILGKHAASIEFFAKSLIVFRLRCRRCRSIA